MDATGNRQAQHPIGRLENDPKLAEWLWEVRGCQEPQYGSCWVQEQDERRNGVNTANPWHEVDFIVLVKVIWTGIALLKVVFVQC